MYRQAVAKSQTQTNGTNISRPGFQQNVPKPEVHLRALNASMVKLVYKHEMLC
jgi:hypothetical protein